MFDKCLDAMKEEDEIGDADLALLDGVDDTQDEEQ